MLSTWRRYRGFFIVQNYEQTNLLRKAEITAMAAQAVGNYGA